MEDSPVEDQDKNELVMKQQHRDSVSTKNLRVFCVVMVAMSLVGWRW